MGGSPIAGWFIRENPIKMDDDWGDIVHELLIPFSTKLRHGVFP